MNTKTKYLNPGQSVVLTRTDSGYCTVERATSGLQIRYVRHDNKGGLVVFHTVNTKSGVL